jgi:hypothetical protein
MSKNRAKVFSLWCSVSLIVCLFYGETFAAEIEVISHTRFQFREDARDNNFATLYEYIDLDVNNIVDGRLSFHSSGWFRYDLDSVNNSDRENDEILYVYLTYSPFMDRRLLFNLGRHFVFEGVASEQLDGVSARWEILPLVGVSAFGGVPVETDFDDRDSDYIFGGRIFLRIQQRAEIGFSYLTEENDGSSYREELGVDVWLLPVKWLEVQGHSFWNAKTDGWMEHSYTMRIFPIDRLILSALVSHTDYDDAFSATTLSAFLPEIVGDDEELTKIGPSVEYQFNAWLSGVANYTRYEYDNAGSADFYGVTLRAHLPEQGLAAGASLHRMDGDTERLRYLKARAYATKTFEAFEISLDTIILHYDESFSGLNTAYSMNGSFAYKFSDSLLASASIYYSKNPDFDHEVRAFLKLVYHFGKEI